MMNPDIVNLDEVMLLLILESTDRMRRRRRLEEEEQRRRRRRFWTHPLMSQRVSVGYFTQIFTELRTHPDKFFNFTRMSVAMFDELMEKLRPRLTRLDTLLRRPVSPEERLLVTLRFLATGQSFASLHHYFLLGVSTISEIVKWTCQAVWEELRAELMPEPTEQMWESVQNLFWEKTQFPNCIGAVDGKHIRVKKPPKSGSAYFNYKKYFSIVLLALSDANLKFIFVDVGAYGSTGDSRIFRESTFGRRLHEGNLNIPHNRPLPGTEEPALPLVMIGDEAFGLSENMMRPYSGTNLTHEKRIFNYRLSRARRVVECAFGVCSAKWRVLLSSMQLHVDNAVNVVLACCILHNFLRIHDSTPVEPEPSNPRHRVQFLDLRPTARVMAIRNQFAQFFVSPEGAVSWQDDHI